MIESSVHMFLGAQPRAARPKLKKDRRGGTMENAALSTRQKKVLEYIKTRESAGLEEICRDLSISESTARRMLSALEEKKLVKRFRGGAMMPPAENVPELPVVRRSQEMLREKRALARAACGHIKNGDTILLTSGSTVQQLCAFLGDFTELTVLTDSLLVQNELMHNKNIQLVLLGGILNAQEQCTYGFLTTENAAHFKIDTMFTSAKGLNVHRGFMTDDMQHMPLYRRFMKLSDRVIALADHTKLYQDGKAVLYNFSEVSLLLLDDAVPRPLVRTMQENGCAVSLCPSV